MFAEKYSRCTGNGGGVAFWMRGVYKGQSSDPKNPGPDDSYPGDRDSGLFGGGVSPADGTVWITGAASKFLVTPNPFNVVCDKRWASTPHTSGINVCLADGSVRHLSAGTDPNTWWAAVTPSNGDLLGSDW
ncbi:H-X9-DG-CTERM domain-containing protein [Frigoriglobus tundricola]|uniref:H-X9-DG-CTERM domain-containing protein n=1 Tax=Frigoriglobus tundricola TaxID=2774151 RepID=UPI0036F2BBD5